MLGTLSLVMLRESSPDSVKSYMRARRAAAKALSEEKAQTWEDFEEAMEKDFWMASKMLWQTIQHLKR